MDIGTLTGKISLEDQMTTVLAKVNDVLEKFGESATAQAKKAETLGASLSKVGKGLSMLSVPIVAFGTAAVAAGFSVEGAYNTIARKTGETGEKLGALKKDFEAVFVQVPNSAQEVAAAIADVNIRLGLTGQELQSVTKKFLDFANVNQVDVATATRTVSTVMKALSADTELTAAEIGNASSIMDKLTYASQQSGASVTQLAHGVVQGGLAFVEMGFGLDESIALFTQFEKVGANVTDVTSSLHRTMGNLAKEGVTDLAGAFKGLVAEIRDAPAYADSVRLSIEAFGMKAGPKLAEEIRSGTYSIDALAKTLKGLGDITNSTAKNSQSFTEDLGTLRNQITMALAPVGIQLIGHFKALIPAMTDAAKALTTVLKLFSDLPKPVQTAVFAIGGLTAVLGPVVLALSTFKTPLLWLASASGIPATSLTVAGLITQLKLLYIALTPLAGVFAGLGIALGLATLGFVKYKQAQADAAVAQQTSNAQMDSINIAIANGAPKMLSYAGAVKFMADKFATVKPAVTDATESVDVMKERMNKLRSEAMEPLSAQVKKDIKDLHELEYEVEAIAKATKASEPAVKRYIKQLEEGGKAAKKTAEDQKELADFIKQTNFEIGLGIGQWKNFTEKIEVYTQRITDAIIDSALAQKAAQDELNDIVHKETMGRVAFEIYQLEKASYNKKLLLDKDVANYAAAAKAIDDLTAKQKDVINREDEIDSALGVGQYADKGPPLAESKWKSAIASIGGAFSDMFEGVNNKVSQIFKVMGSGLDFIVNKAKNVGEQVAAALAMAASVLSTILGDKGGKVGAMAVGALSGAAAGAGIGTMIAPGVGTAVGAGIGAVVGAIGGWIGATNKAIAATAEATAKVQAFKAELVKTYGSLENLEEISQRLGMSFVGEWANEGTEGLKKITEFTAEFEKRLKLVDQAIRKIVTGLDAVVKVGTEGFATVGDAVKTAQENLDKLVKSGTATADQLKTATDAVTKALTEQHAASEKNKQLLDDMGIQAVATFAAVFAATGSYSQALTAVAPSVTTLVKAYKDLGLEVEDVFLKQLMIQSAVQTSSPSLIAAINGQTGAMQGMAQMGLLNSTTFSSMQRTGNLLYLRLQSETANAAKAAGDLGDQTRNALIPMQAYLQQAAAQAKLLGIPLDENTQMLIDQSKELGIWKDAGKSANDLLIEGITALTGKITEMINAMLRIPSVDAPWAGWEPPPAAPDYSDVGGEPAGPTEPEEPVYAAQGTPFVPRGSDTVPAMLTPGERVLTARDNARFTEQLNAPREQRVTINIGDINVSGVLDEGGLLQTVQRKLLPMITRSIEDNVGGARTNLQELLLTEGA